MNIFAIFFYINVFLYLFNPGNRQEITLPDTNGFAVKKQEKKEEIKWMTLTEAETKSNLQKKDILIDLYTDWCGWCKVMDKNTYSNTNVIHYIQEKFYPVKLNAETRETLTWQGKPFHYNDKYRVHDYAIFLTGGQLSYPTTIILPADGSRPQLIPGYLKTPDMELILRYFGEGYYGKTPFEDYRKNFSQTWK